MTYNRIKIQVGLTSADPVWDTLLHQIGIAYKVIVPSGPEDPSSEYSVIIVNDDRSTSSESIDTYLQSGGAVLYTTDAVSMIRRRSTSTRNVISLPPRSTALYTHADILDLDSSVSFFANNDLADAERAGSGTMYFLGIDLKRCFTYQKRRRNFYTPSGRMPNEIVSGRSKGSIRQLIFSLLNVMHHRRSLPFIHQWYFPGDERTIFTFRIDSDKGTQEQIEEIRSLSSKYSVPTAWFLDVKSHEPWLPYFSSFGSQEIGLHCYDHVMHRSADLNRDNFSKALTLLRSVGIHPKGITAPTGAWNAGYAESIRQLGFRYSSEFSYDYDDLPSFPILNGERFPIPQLPIHPVCIGSMLRARMDTGAMTEYFKKVINRNKRLSEPVCLYHHPTHRHNEVFQEVFEYIDSLSIAKLSYSDYAEWWRHRHEHCTAVMITDSVIEAAEDTGNVRHRVILPDGRETIIGLNGNQSLNSLSCVRIDRDIDIPADIMRTRKFTPRHFLQNALDWWITITE